MSVSGSWGYLSGVLVGGMTVVLGVASPVQAQNQNKEQAENKKKSSFVDYTVKEGDTCIGIAIRELGGRENYRLIHQNNSLGALPHHLKPGQILRLPRQGPLVPDSNLSKSRGTVKVRQSTTTDWNQGLLGMDLFRRWRVNAAKRSTAEITFRDTSRLRMREDTIVIIYGPSAERTRRGVSRVTLKSGVLRTRLAELNGRQPQPTLVVETASSEVELGAGSALVGVDASETSRVSNHSGTAAKLRSRAKNKRRRRKRRTVVAVGPGMGSKVEPDKEPTPPKPLPATPEWTTQGPTVFVGWAHTGATLRGSWTAIPSAQEYRIEISRDLSGDDVITSVVVPATVTTFEAHRFPVGDYFVTLAARDADQFESKPSPPRKLHVTSISLTPLSASAPLVAAQLEPNASIDSTSSVPPQQVLVGSVAVPSQELSCAIDTSPVSTSLTFVDSGETVVRCRDAQGTALDPLSVRVVGLHSTLGFPELTSQSRIPRNSTAEISLTVAGDSDLALGDVDTSSLFLKLSPGLELISRNDVNGAIHLVVHTLPNAPEQAFVQLLLAEGGPLLATHDVSIEPLHVKQARVPKPRVRHWEVGALVGGMLVDDQFALGNATNANGVLDDGAIVGIRLAHHFTSSLAIEAEGTYSEPGFVALLSHANVLGYRVHGLLHLRKGRLKPFVLAGFGGTHISTNAIGVRNDADKEAYWGLGLRFFKNRRMNLRFDLRHRVSRGRVDRFSHLLEASFGIGWQL